MREEAPQREHDLRDVYNGLRVIVRTGAQWRMMPHDLAWATVYQQTQRLLKRASLRQSWRTCSAVLRLAEGRNEQPSASHFCSRTDCNLLRKQGTEPGYVERKRRQEQQCNLAVDNLGHLLALHVTPANEQDRRLRLVNWLLAVQDVTGPECGTGTSLIKVIIPVMNRDKPPKEQGIRIGGRQDFHSQARVRAVCHADGWWSVVIAWMTRFRRLARDYERYPETLAGLHLLLCSAHASSFCPCYVAHDRDVHNRL